MNQQNRAHFLTPIPAAHPTNGGFSLPKSMMSRVYSGAGVSIAGCSGLLGSVVSISGVKRSAQSSYSRQAENTPGARWLQHHVRGGRRSCLLRSMFRHGSTRAIEGRLRSAKPLRPLLMQTNMSRIYKVIRIRISFEKAFKCVSDVTNYCSNRTSERRRDSASPNRDGVGGVSPVTEERFGKES